MAEPQRTRRRWWVALVLAAYLALLVASTAWRILIAADDPADACEASVATLPVRDGSGAEIADRALRVCLARWGEPDADRLPVVLLHGSPGSKANFVALGPLIADRGRRVLAPDLPGSGHTAMTPDMSLASQARVVIDLMDHEGIERAHIVGWSSGGGVAIRAAQQHPDRVASITMLASIGAQHTEGSGSFLFEHAKYAAGIGVLGALPELIPHFGALGDFRARAGWLVAFWDSDQRDMARVMRGLETPTLIVHGRRDPLVPDWAAEAHKRIMDDSARLVMLDAMHFMPFTMPGRTGEILSAHFDRHDDPAAPALTGVVDEAPLPDRGGAAALVTLIGRALTPIPWWIEALAIVVLARWRPWSASVACGLFVATARLDPGVALVGLFAGACWGCASRATRSSGRGPSGGMSRAGCGCSSRSCSGARGRRGRVARDRARRRGRVDRVLRRRIVTLAAISRVAAMIHRRGRWRTHAVLTRLRRHEYWPTWALYLPVMIRIPFWFVRLRGARAITALNPGYGDDAGGRSPNASP